MDKPHIHFYHWPRSRGTVAHALLEELNADYETHLINIATGEQHEPEYLAINPMAKVPAIVHDGALITELPAIFIYLGDLHPEAGLTPPVEDPLRGLTYAGWCSIARASNPCCWIGRCNGFPDRARRLAMATTIRYSKH